ncbi:DUF1657 domain-containing protein [Brevibacillus sp. SYP-B805]|jgi:hypothetical protein|uniref:DUF1657 domain-containing protein n=1 Tax=Brevibacillus sp. SYP-B805 TaxID=1578199 RepID=UPI0013EC0021|nr:DUF1657 domain-containing protein [Brevibacillus sp. SYP-B805]NGQ94910.1 DUF1657 domain-containing protein [Brevibacillus sp. SYP-B805]
MTVGVKMQQTLASAQSVLANLNSFALETQDQAAKAMFNSLAQTQKTVCDQLSQRLQYIQEQEPQYKQQ